MNSKNPSAPAAALGELLISHAEAETKIEMQIERGQDILRPFRLGTIRTQDDLDEERRNYRKWTTYNSELLLRIFSTDSVAREFERVPARADSRYESLEEKADRFRRSVEAELDRLESVRERLELIPVRVGVPATPGPASTSSTKVFIVHGHDERARESVARFVERLGLDVVILHEQPNQGRTIIEKFETYAEVSFAVVLLTPDDVGAAQSTADQLNRRARQNVIFELGFFFGRLGRNRVCALYAEGVEFPSDIHGILYVPLDSPGAWKLQLAKEMKLAGLPIDLNHAL
jgi:predicted nucleotide-binding protein